MDKKAIQIFFLSIITVLNFRCTIKIPEKPTTLNDYTYNTYRDNLKKAIADKDKFQIGIQLCNLKQSKEIVYSFLRKGISENKKNCTDVLRWNQYYLQDNFKVNIIKIDTAEWKKLCHVCLNDKKAVEAYNQDEIDRIRKHEESVRKLNIDSSKFNRQLIDLLTEIKNDDQRYRGKIDYIKKLPQQDYLDSINLKKVEKIISDRDYPSYREVGLDLSDVVLLVLHHQRDVTIRKKYLPYLEAAVKDKKLSQGFLEIYNYRTKTFE